MPRSNDRLDRVILEARRNADKRAAGYRAQALKLFPWVCGGCARTFTHSNLQLLEVHHKNGNHDDNPPDGSNWELLCLYCHDNEHQRQIEAAAMGARGGTSEDKPPATHSPFANLKAMLERKGRK
jgi:5-methylcytosine-specific restriction endonuclease McrA